MRPWRAGALAAWLALAAACGETGPDAAALHRDALVLDTQADTTQLLLDPDWRFEDRHDDGHVDLPRLREGGLDAVFWSIFLPQPQPEGAALRGAREQIEAVRALVARLPEELALATTAAEVRAAVASGRIACLMGLEGGHLIEESLPALRELHGLGARYLTLTHAKPTSWADSAGTWEAPPLEHDGLTPFGEEVVRELNRLGMLVDVSHVADATFWDALRVSRAPLIASHSSVRAVADHPRNLSDDMLRALAGAGGVVMINFYSGYVDPELVAPIRRLFQRLGPEFAALAERHAGDPGARRRAYRELLAREEVPRTRLDVVLDHFDHALDVAGPNHVGLGADWDGVPSMPRELDDVSRLPALTEGLLARGHAPETVRKVLGENLLRAMEEAERVSRELGP